MHVFTFSKCSTIATLAGCPNALNNIAVSFCFELKCAVFVAPNEDKCNKHFIILQYYDNDLFSQLIPELIHVEGSHYF